MTGGGGAGGSGCPPRDVWRGVRESSRGPGPRPGEPGGKASGAGAASGVEVEDLPVQPVVRRGSARPGVGGILAVVAIVALLAAGFGVLGGRPDTPPGPSSAAVAPSGDPSSADPTQDPGPPPIPLVTPWIECGDQQTPTPSIVLQVNGQAIPGVVEVLADGLAGSLPPPVVFPRPQSRTDVPVDVVSELWVEGGLCAVAWTIDLVDDQTLDSVPNSARDPRYAAQNRFQLQLGPHPGGDVDLRAVLVFPPFVARAVWPIRIVPVEAPVVALHTEGRRVEPVEGCDVALTLATGWSNPLNPCVDDIGEPPGSPAAVRPGERLTFEIVGWRTDAGGVVCGRLSGQSFIAQPETGCNVGEVVASPFVFAAPSEPGRWTLAISACGSRDGTAVAALNRVCGTWYVNILVED